jgi:hypothetical protein
MEVSGKAKAGDVLAGLSTVIGLVYATFVSPSLEPLGAGAYTYAENTVGFGERGNPEITIPTGSPFAVALVSPFII